MAIKNASKNEKCVISCKYLGIGSMVSVIGLSQNDGDSMIMVLMGISCLPLFLVSATPLYVQL